MPLTRVTITLQPDHVTGADDLARRRGTSRSRVLAEALEAYLATSAEPRRPGQVAESAAGAHRTALSDEALLAELRNRLAARATAHPESEPLDPHRPRVGFDRDHLAAVCRRHHVAKLALFGSVLTDEFSPASDVDVLVEFEPGHTPGLAIADLEDELSAVFGGRRVDVVTARSLHRLIRDRVLASAVVQFAA
jgi:predicted nucleotidyltransferase/predicted transcriptional regulator